MMLPVVLIPAAADEFEHAVAWYEAEQPGLGARFKNAVLSAFEAIQRHPRAYPRTYRRLRRVRVKRFPYLVLYTIDPSCLRVIAVFHGHRNPAEWITR